MNIHMDVADAVAGKVAKYKDFVCRPLRREDLSELADWPQFEERSLSWANFPASTPELQKRWLRNQTKPYIAWIGARHPAGGAESDLIGRISFSQPLSGKCWIFGIVLRPDMLEMGMGTELTQIMVRYALELGNIDIIWLESRHDNSRAHRVWEKVGFQKQGKHFRREVFGRYDRYVGYTFNRNDIDKLPEIQIDDIIRNPESG